MDETIPPALAESFHEEVEVSKDIIQGTIIAKESENNESEAPEVHSQIESENIIDPKTNDNIINKKNSFYSKCCPWITSDMKTKNAEKTRIFEGNENKDFLNRIRTTDVKPISNSSFELFNINSNILLAMTENQWHTPSPIQEISIPKIMEGKNVIARSKNGTGKTGAYAISMLNTVDSQKNLQVLILTPTRELALQIGNVCLTLSKYLNNIKIMVSTGGTNLSEDLYRLSKSVNVLIGTPGRILDLLIHRFSSFADMKTLILDEADKLLSLDFQPLIEDIITNLPNECQKILFSATYPLNLKSFVKKYIANCEYCNVMNELTLKGVTQLYAYLKESQKVACLKVLFEKLEIQQAIIFCNSSNRVELLAKFIIEAGYSSYYIHSKMSQEARNRVFHDFRCGFVTFLVCTDIMTRGIDVSNVNVVFNFDFPIFSETYLHRIGRCGRFGRLGIAINFITDIDRNRFKQIENEIGEKVLPIPKTIDKRLYVYSYQTFDKFKVLDT